MQIRSCKICSIATCFIVMNFVTSNISAQNLVLNGGFEEHRPERHSVLIEETLLDWYSFFNTPEYYNVDFSSESMIMDYCGTLPRNGRGMVGGYQLGFFESLNGYNRQYFQGTLSETLTQGQVYKVEFYVKPLLSSPVINFAIDNIGVAFTDKRFTTNDDAPQFIIPLTPIVEYTNHIITDRSEWTKVSGCFTADGTETFIVLGNFRTDQNTKASLLPGAVDEDILSYGWSFYFFDDVSVEAVVAPIIEPDNAMFCKDSNFVIQAFHPDAQSYSWSNNTTTDTTTINAAGTYTVSVTTNDGCVVTQDATYRTIPCVSECPALVLPNAFTPNGDGLNDNFRVFNIGDMYNAAISIFNRWGERVFVSYKSDEAWDGTYHGKACESGTYFYRIQYIDCHQQTQYLTGDVHLIR